MPDTSPAQPHTVDFVDSVRSLPDHPVASIRVRSVLAVVAGVALVLVALAGVVVTILGADVAGGLLFGCAFLAAMGALLVYTGVRRLMRLGSVVGDRVRLAAPHAFRITDSAIEFPAYLEMDAESWPRVGTTVRVGRRVGMETLVLEHPGRPTRRYPARMLREPPGEIAARVRA